MAHSRSGIKREGIITTSEASFHNGLGHLMGAVDWGTGLVNVSFVYGPYGEILDSPGMSLETLLDGKSPQAAKALAKLKNNVPKGGPLESASVEEETHRRRFNGKEADQLSRLNYYGYRYYDPLSLSWTQADPKYLFVPDASGVEPRRMGLYQFSLNNPLRYLDPDGLDPSFSPPKASVIGHQSKIFYEIMNNPDTDTARTELRSAVISAIARQSKLGDILVHSPDAFYDTGASKSFMYLRFVGSVFHEVAHGEWNFTLEMAGKSSVTESERQAYGAEIRFYRQLGAKRIITKRMMRKLVANAKDGLSAAVKRLKGGSSENRESRIQALVKEYRKKQDKRVSEWGSVGRITGNGEFDI